MKHKIITKPFTLYRTPIHLYTSAWVGSSNGGVISWCGKCRPAYYDPDVKKAIHPDIERPIRAEDSEWCKDCMDIWKEIHPNEEFNKASHYFVIHCIKNSLSTCTEVQNG
jgi:hypothetical protein